MNSKILMISTGGTLASSHGGNGLSPRLGGSEILKKISGLTAGFEVDEEELFSLDSSNAVSYTHLGRQRNGSAAWAIDRSAVIFRAAMASFIIRKREETMPGPGSPSMAF